MIKMKSFSPRLKKIKALLICTRHYLHTKSQNEEDKNYSVFLCADKFGNQVNL
jgi:hypothetical protein